MSEGVRRMERIARRLAARAPTSSAGRGRALPSLWLFTDSDRTPDAAAIAERLPRGTGIVHRTFGRPEAIAMAETLVAIARRRGLVLLIGADEVLAARVGAAGVHLPERVLGRGRMLRARRPGWIVTGAAHSARALSRARAVGLDAAFLSPAFESASPSATTALGAMRLAALTRGAGLRVYALGGVDARTAAKLLGTGVAGLAAVDGFRT